MSWDVYAVRGAHGRSLEDVPTGRELPVIGTTQDVVDEVRKAAPDVDATDPTWLTLTGDDHEIQMSLGKDVHVRDITFFIHGGGPAAVAVVLDVCRALRLNAYDTETGERLTASSTPPGPPPVDEPQVKRRWWRR